MNKFLIKLMLRTVITLRYFFKYPFKNPEGYIARQFLQLLFLIVQSTGALLVFSITLIIFSEGRLLIGTLVVFIYWVIEVLVHKNTYDSIVPVNNEKNFIADWVKNHIPIIETDLLNIAHGIIGLLFVTLIVLPIGRYAWILFVDGRPCKKSSIVKSVGGCDAFGNCGVLLEDGTIVTVRHPAPNQRLCIEKGWPPLEFFWSSGIKSKPDSNEAFEKLKEGARKELDRRRILDEKSTLEDSNNTNFTK